MIIRWTRIAEADLVAQCDQIAMDDPALAVRIGGDIIKAVQGLADFPYRGRAGRVEATRELVLAGWPWIVVYTISDNAILVLRLLHGAQAYPAGGSD